MNKDRLIETAQKVIGTLQALDRTTQPYVDRAVVRIGRLLVRALTVAEDKWREVRNKTQ